jgi:hypothetical protein
MGHELAQRIVKRRHFKVVYERAPADVAVNPEAGAAVLGALQAQFARQQFRHDRYSQKGGAPNFPVRRRDGSVESSLTMSGTLERLPVVVTDYVFADRSIAAEAAGWVRSHRQRIIQPSGEGDYHGET